MPRLSAPSSSGVGIRSLFGSTGTSDTDACLCRNEKSQTGESDYIDNAAVFSALSKVKDGLKCHGKRILVACGSWIS